VSLLVYYGVRLLVFWISQCDLVAEVVGAQIFCACLLLWFLSGYFLICFCPLIFLSFLVTMMVIEIQGLFPLDLVLKSYLGGQSLAVIVTWFYFFHVLIIIPPLFENLLLGGGGLGAGCIFL
jgi:hypothetical protein